MDYFAKHGYIIQKSYNPADFYMKLLTVNYPKKEEDLERIEKFNTMYAEIGDKVA